MICLVHSLCQSCVNASVLKQIYRFSEQDHVSSIVQLVHRLEHLGAPCSIPAREILAVGPTDHLAAQLWETGAQITGATVQPEGIQPFIYAAASSQSTY